MCIYICVCVCERVCVCVRVCVCTTCTVSAYVCIAKCNEFSIITNLFLDFSFRDHLFEMRRLPINFIVHTVNRLHYPLA